MKKKLPRTHKQYEQELRDALQGGYDDGWKQGQNVLKAQYREYEQKNSAEAQKAKTEAIRALSGIAIQMAIAADALSKALLSNAGQL